jgi:hypothetical protein
MLFTFGMLFPLLAIIGCISILFHNTLRMIVVGRLFILYDNHAKQLTTVLRQSLIRQSSESTFAPVAAMEANHMHACQELYRMIYNIYDSIPLFSQWMKQSYVPLVFWMYFLWSWFLFDMIGDQYGLWPGVTVFVCMLGVNWSIFLGMEMYQISLLECTKSIYERMAGYMRQNVSSPPPPSSSADRSRSRSTIKERQQSILIEATNGEEEEDGEDGERGMEMSIIVNPMISKPTVSQQY